LRDGIASRSGGPGDCLPIPIAGRQVIPTVACRCAGLDQRGRRPVLRWIGPRMDMGPRDLFPHGHCASFGLRYRQRVSGCQRLNLSRFPSPVHSLGRQRCDGSGAGRSGSRNSDPRRAVGNSPLFRRPATGNLGCSPGSLAAAFQRFASDTGTARYAASAA